MSGEADQILRPVCQQGRHEYRSLSEATLEKFIARGFIREYTDIFHLDRYQDEIRNMEGFGEKSYRNLIESARKQELLLCRD